MVRFNMDMVYVGGKCRWGTSEKITTITKYLKTNYGEDYKEYVRYSSR